MNPHSMRSKITEKVPMKDSVLYFDFLKKMVAGHTTFDFDWHSGCMESKMAFSSA